MGMILPLLPFVMLAAFYHGFRVIYAIDQEKRKPPLVKIEKEPTEELLSLQVYCKAMLISDVSLQEISTRLAKIHKSMPEDAQTITFDKLTYDKGTMVITCNKVIKKHSF